ncbi:hypothetical protein [Actinokineospora enzanensis]|uniref:hypothetical protein n=1 Tax=Actinokineospora enzanensis TaxID=155975 RepID=UPI00036C1FA7|nr:hypothetical protein [Actinokineospora enzanensis]
MSADRRTVGTAVRATVTTGPAVGRTVVGPGARVRATIGPAVGTTVVTTGDTGRAVVGRTRGTAVGTTIGPAVRARATIRRAMVGPGTGIGADRARGVPAANVVVFERHGSSSLG